MAASPERQCLPPTGAPDCKESDTPPDALPKAGAAADPVETGPVVAHLRAECCLLVCGQTSRPTGRARSNLLSAAKSKRILVAKTAPCTTAFEWYVSPTARQISRVLPQAAATYPSHRLDAEPSIRQAE